ncbi:ATP-binding protein [Clostridium beijerinckii]|uniref:ATP-binding protein n=1 Tax=Clostridium beijerinckii TaxID=1520 RepID=UPI0022E0CB63|nr:ATP-binding protein [Clostridium beijerinckii]
MKLRKLKIENFRGYSTAEIDFDSEMNVIIGKNDVGKSTIMDSLEIFFNGDAKDSQVKIEIDDLNVNCNENKEIKIACCFSVDTEEEILVDTTNRTNLKEEYLFNKEGLLEIVKVWNCSKSKINSSDLKISLIANYPNIFEEPLINCKIKDLKKRLDDIKDEVLNYETINKTKSAEIRKALYDYYIKDDKTELQEVEIDLSKEDAKNIWSSVKTNLPLFFLFQSDRNNTDSDSEVQNPLKIATKNALADMEKVLNDVKKQVEEQVKKIGEKTIEKLKELDESIAQNLKTELKLKPWDSVFSFDLIADNNIPLNKRGSGVRRLMLLSYFRAEAERIIQESTVKDIIYAIEEPETSQHPDYQKMIIESLIDISKDNRHQIVLTTHTPEIAKMVDIEQLIFIKKDEFNIPKIENDMDTKIKNIIGSLGILPNITSKLVICVEGENDVNFLKNINNNVIEYKEIIDIENEGINIIPFGGSNLKRWINENYLKGSNVKEVHIYDNDVKDYADKIKEINEVSDGRRFGWITNRREMENYISPNLIEQELAITIDEKHKTKWDEIDVSKLLVDKVLTNIPNVKDRETNIKIKLNKNISKRINRKILEELGVYEELKVWFVKIKEIFQS